MSNDSHYVGIMYAGRTAGEDDCVYIAINTYWEPFVVTLPNSSSCMEWYCVADTYEEESVIRDPYRLEDGKFYIHERSVMIFEVREKEYRGPYV